MKQNNELDFLCTDAKIYMYDKRSFDTKKRKWSFHCLNCEEKFSSDNEQMTHYYVWNHLEFGEAISSYNHLMMCSTDCIHSMLERLNFDVQAWNNELIELEKSFK